MRDYDLESELTGIRKRSFCVFVQLEIVLNDKQDFTPSTLRNVPFLNSFNVLLKLPMRCESIASLNGLLHSVTMNYGSILGGAQQGVHA
jgi:hypothetical protein